MSADTRAAHRTLHRFGCTLGLGHPKPQAIRTRTDPSASETARSGVERPPCGASTPSVQPRPGPASPRIPSYRLHKATGQAVVTLSGRDHYLGRHGTPESKAAYERLLATYLASGRSLPEHRAGRGSASPNTRGAGFTVAELCDGFLAWAKVEYRQPDGTVGREVENVRDEAQLGVSGRWVRRPQLSYHRHQPLCADSAHCLGHVRQASVMPAGI